MSKTKTKSQPKTKPRYIDIPADEFLGFFEKKNFTRRVNGNEIVLCFSHLQNPKIKILIHTTISVDADDTRDYGSDSIKVSAILETHKAGETKCYGLYKGKRIFRTGTVEGVLTRTRAEALKAYERGTAWNIENKEKFKKGTYLS